MMKRPTQKKISRAGAKRPAKPVKPTDKRVKSQTVTKESPVPPTGPDRVLQFAEQLEQTRTQARGEEAVQDLETWVTCRLDQETFAFRVSQVTEILRVTHVARVPDAPFPVRGVTNLRGQVLPVVDLRLRLGLEPIEARPHHRIVVISSRGHSIGLLVDSVDQIIEIDKNAIEPPPADVMTERSHYLLGVSKLNDNLLLMLDAERVLQIHETTTAP